MVRERFAGLDLQGLSAHLSDLQANWPDNTAQACKFGRVRCRADRASLHEKIDLLSEGEVEVVGAVVDAVRAPLYSEPLPTTWLTGSSWTDAFLARLRGHHGLSIEPLSTTQFEAAFNEACSAAGWHVEVAGSATQRFFDTTVTVAGDKPLRLSLKASAAKDMKAERVHISKLTEAAWIQDARRQSDRRDRIVELFQEYQHVTSAIVMLRGFRAREGYHVFYELIEIPTSIFDPVANLTIEQAQAGTIKISDNAEPARFSIRIDRSDSKITLTNIRLELCTIHGRWGLERA
jgi:Type II site-specific deoxyribonuclease